MNRDFAVRMVLTTDATLFVVYGLGALVVPPSPGGEYLTMNRVIFGFAPLAAAAVSLVAAIWSVPDSPTEVTEE